MQSSSSGNALTTTTTTGQHGKLRVEMSRVKGLYFDTLETECPNPVLRITLPAALRTDGASGPMVWQTPPGNGPDAYFNYTLDTALVLPASLPSDAPVLLFDIFDASRQPSAHMGTVSYRFPVLVYSSSVEDLKAKEKALAQLARCEPLSLALEQPPNCVGPIGASGTLGTLTGKIVCVFEKPIKSGPVDPQPDLVLPNVPVLTCEDELSAALPSDESMCPEAACTPELRASIRAIRERVLTSNTTCGGWYLWLRLVRDHAWRTDLLDAMYRHGLSLPAQKKGESLKRFQDVFLRRFRVTRLHQFNTKLRLYAQGHLLRVPFAAYTATEENRMKAEWKRRSILHEEILFQRPPPHHHPGIPASLQTILDHCWWSFTLGCDTASPPSVEVRMQHNEASFPQEAYEALSAALCTHLLDRTQWDVEAGCSIGAEDYQWDTIVKDAGGSATGGKVHAAGESGGAQKLFQRIVLRHALWWSESLTLTEVSAFLSSLIPCLISCKKWREEAMNTSKNANTTTPAAKAFSGRTPPTSAARKKPPIGSK